MIPLKFYYNNILTFLEIQGILMKLKSEEYKKFGFLSAILSLIVGIYWLLRPIKDALFTNMVDTFFLPYAKIVSAVVLIPIILLYSKLVDLFEKKQQLFYVITPLYGLFFLVIAFLLNNRYVGFDNLKWHKDQILGWLVYLGVESFILVIYSLFWSFVSSITSTSSAKKGYHLIVAGAQIGAIIGSEFTKHAPQLGIPILIFIAACGMFIIPILVMLFIKLHYHTINSSQLKKTTGFIEGLKLLISRPYLLGILGIATLGSMVSTTLEFALILKAKETYQSTTKIVESLGFYGQSINFLTLIFALFFTKIIIKKCGLNISLRICPIVVGVLTICVWVLPSLRMLFFVTVIIKCVLYGLNNPCKEMAYIQTSDNIKFKTKGWIDTIGYRLAESIGGMIFLTISNLTFFGSSLFIMLCVILLWIICTIYVGRKHFELMQNNQTIE